MALSKLSSIGILLCRYARMLSEGHKMNIIYFDPYPNKFLEEYIRDYGKLLESKGEPGVTITRLETVEDVLREADVSMCSLIRSCNTWIYSILSVCLSGHSWFSILSVYLKVFQPEDTANCKQYLNLSISMSLQTTRSKSKVQTYHWIDLMSKICFKESSDTHSDVGQE